MLLKDVIIKASLQATDEPCSFMLSQHDLDRIKDYTTATHRELILHIGAESEGMIKKALSLEKEWSAFQWFQLQILPMMTEEDQCDQGIYNWDLFPQNERQVAKFHFQVVTRFMLFRLQALKRHIIYQGCCLIWGPNPIISLRNPFVFYWFLTCSMSHISFSSLATCRSFCENRSQLWYSKLSGGGTFIGKTIHVVNITKCAIYGKYHSGEVILPMVYAPEKHQY